MRLPENVRQALVMLAIAAGLMLALFIAASLMYR
jgi:hypothetical protein